MSDWFNRLNRSLEHYRDQINSVITNHLFGFYNQYQSQVERHSRFISEQVGVEVRPVVLKAIHLSVLALTLLGIKTLYDRTNKQQQEIPKVQVKIPQVVVAPITTSMTAATLHGSGSRMKKDLDYPSYLRDPKKIYSKPLAVTIPWRMSDLDVDPTHLYGNPSMYLQQTDNQVAWVAERNTKSGQERTLLGMKVIYRAKDQEERTFPCFETYKTYTQESNLRDHLALCRHVLGLDRESDVPKDIVFISYRFFSVQDKLSPDIRVLSLPPVAEWHWRELETFYLMRRILEIPELESVTSGLNLPKKRALFNLLFNSWDKLITKNLYYPPEVGKYLMGLKLTPKEELGREILAILTSSNEEELSVLRDRLWLSKPKIMHHWRMYGPYNKKNLYISDWSDEIKNMSRVYSDPEIRHYVSDPVYDMLAKESLLLPFVWDEITSLWEHLECVTYDQYVVERVLSKFSRDTTVVITPHSDQGDEGFACRRLLISRNITSVERITNENLEPYFKRDRIFDRTYEDKMPLDMRVSKTYYRQFKAFEKERPTKFNDDRLSFDLDALEFRNMVKERTFEGTQPADINDHLRFMISGIRVFDWLLSFESRLFGSQWTWWAHGLLSARTLCETNTFWRVSTYDYIESESVKYVSYGRKHFPQGSYPLMENYLKSLLVVLSVPHNRWISFCLRHLDLETARRIIENVEPNIGTFLRTNENFIKSIDDRYSALEMHRPDKEVSGLLDHWAKHSLCNFVWHRAHMSSVLKELRDNEHSDKCRLEEMRLDFLTTVPEEDMISRDLELYMKLYAAQTLRDNLVDQMIQIQVSSGLKAQDIDQTVYRTYFDIKPRVSFKNTTPSDFHSFNELRGAQQEILSCSSELDRETTDHVRNMLVTQSETISEYGIAPYTYWSGLTQNSVVKSPSKTEQGPENIPGYCLPDLTMPTEDQSWQEYDLNDLTNDSV